MKRKMGGASIDALALSFVRIVTIVISMVIYKMLAVYFSVEEYGTYASATLVATTATSLTILGLTDAVNYFYAKDRDNPVGKVYVYTIFLIQLVVGFVSAVVIWLLKNQIAVYFDKPAVAGLIPGVAFIPVLTNLANMLQVLFVTAQKAKVIAVRNLFISILKIASIAVICLWLKDIKAVIITTLVLDIGTVIYMLIYCKKNIFFVDIRKAKPSLSKEILRYSIPMAAYILTNTLSKNIDKLVIGALGSAEMLGIYSIAAKELPFDVLTTSFLTVLLPYITGYVGRGDNEKAAELFSKYLCLTYTVTWIIAGGALACAEDLMLVLYDEKYISGIGVFCLYIVVDMMKFANVSIIFSISDKGKELLKYSCGALALNAVLNVVLFNVMGIIGPAISTVIITLGLSVVIMCRSAKLLGTKVNRILQIKPMIFLLVQCGVCATISLIVKHIINIEGMPLLNLVITYAVYAIPLVLLNCKKIIALLKEINCAKIA